MYQAGLAVLCINVTPETSAAGVHPPRPGTSARPGEGAGRGKPSPGLPGQAPASLPGQAAKVPRRSIRSAADGAGGSPGAVDTGCAVLLRSAVRRRPRRPGPVGDGPDLVGHLRPHLRGQVVPDNLYADILTRVLTGLLGPPSRP